MLELAVTRRHCPESIWLPERIQVVDNPAASDDTCSFIVELHQSSPEDISGSGKGGDAGAGAGDICAISGAGSNAGSEDLMIHVRLVPVRIFQVMVLNIEYWMLV